MSITAATGRESGFNSRTRVGATVSDYALIHYIPVSIHAPVWVRHLKPSSPGRVNGFQFTHPCGCDNHQRGQPRTTKGFNSRTRVGATDSVGIGGNWMPSFNSRTRVGATGPLGTDDADPAVSIHAPVWVRPAPLARMTQTPPFQFTHPCGCDRFLKNCGIRITGFNSRTRVGATFFIHRYYLTPAVSIHAPVWVRHP